MADRELKTVLVSWLAISNDKILVYFSKKIYGSNFIKQHSETVMVWNHQNADCSLRKKFIVSFTIIFGTLSFSIRRVNQNLWPLYDLHFLGITRHNVWSWWVKICRVVSIKFNHLVYENVCMIVKMYLCDITVANISESFPHKMAAKTSWHRYESKLRHCHPMYSNTAQCVCVAR